MNIEIADIIMSTLFHSLWQGLLIASLLYVFLFMVKKPAFRYVLAYASLILFFFSSLVTFFFFKGMADNQGNAAALTDKPDLFLPNQIQLSNPITGGLGISDQYLDYVFIVWLFGLLIVALKMCGGLWYVKRLKSLSHANTNTEILAKLDELIQKANVKIKVRIREVVKISAPVVSGIIKPIILFPLGSLNALSLEETEAILAHELAHIKRHDYLLNLFQVALEAIFYFNPFVWWISRIIRDEREKACDDLACAILNNKMQYVHALVKMKEIELQTGKLVLSFSGNKNQLFNRISRILGSPAKKPFIMEKITVLFVSLALIIFFSSAKIVNSANHSPEECQDEVEYVESNDIPTLQSDTIPVQKKVKKTIIKEEEGKKTELVIENDEVQSLKVDGKEVEEGKMSEYEDLIKELKEELQPNSRSRYSVFEFDDAENIFRFNTQDAEKKRAEKMIKREYDIARRLNNRFEFKSPESVIIESETDDDGKTIIKFKQANGDDPVIISIPEISEPIIIDGHELLDGRTIIRGENEFFFSPEIASRIHVRPFKEDFVYEWEDKSAMAYDKALKKFYKNQENWEKKSLKSYKEMDKELRAFELDERTLKQYERAQREMERAKKKMKSGKMNNPSVYVMPDFQFKFDEFNDQSFFVSPGFSGNSALEKKLLQDGLIDDNENYEFKMTDKKLKINGKKQSNKVFDSYREYIEKRMGKNVDGDFNMHIKKNNA